METWRKQLHMKHVRIPSSGLNFSENFKKPKQTAGNPDRKCQATFKAQRQAIKRVGVTQRFNIPPSTHLWKCHRCIWARCDRKAPAWLQSSSFQPAKTWEYIYTKKSTWKCICIHIHTDIHEHTHLDAFFFTTYPHISVNCRQWKYYSTHWKYYRWGWAGVKMSKLVC